MIHDLEKKFKDIQSYIHKKFSDFEDSNDIDVSSARGIELFWFPRPLRLEAEEEQKWRPNGTPSANAVLHPHIFG